MYKISESFLKRKTPSFAFHLTTLASRENYRDLLENFMRTFQPVTNSGVARNGFSWNQYQRPICLFNPCMVFMFLLLRQCLRVK